MLCLFVFVFSLLPFLKFLTDVELSQQFNMFYQILTDVVNVKCFKESHCLHVKSVYREHDVMFVYFFTGIDQFDEFDELYSKKD